jgi:hypothetical protein
MQPAGKHGSNKRTGLFIILFAFFFALALCCNSSVTENPCHDIHQQESYSVKINSVISSGIDFLAYHRICSTGTECFLSLFYKINPAFENRIAGNRIHISLLLDICRVDSSFLIHHYHQCLTDNDDVPPLV